MLQRTGILAVDRMKLMRQAQGAGVFAQRSPSNGMTNDDAFRKYRGFDGRAWPEDSPRQFVVVDGLASIKEIEAVQVYADELRSAEDCDVILVAPSSVRELEVGGRPWKRIGFDVGVFESEWAHFSVLLNEVVYGVSLN